MELLNNANILTPSNYWTIYQTVMQNSYTKDELVNLLFFPHKVDTQGKITVELETSAKKSRRNKVSNTINTLQSLGILSISKESKVTHCFPNIQNSENFRYKLHSLLFADENLKHTKTFISILSWLTLQEPYSSMTHIEYQQNLNSQFTNSAKELSINEDEARGFRKWMAYLGLSRNGDLELNPTRFLFTHISEISCEHNEVQFSEFLTKLNAILPIFVNSPHNEKVRSLLQEQLPKNQIGPILSAWLLEQESMNKIELHHKDDSKQVYLLSTIHHYSEKSRLISHILFCQ